MRVLAAIPTKASLLRQDERRARRAIRAIASNRCAASDETKIDEPAFRVRARARIGPRFLFAARAGRIDRSRTRAPVARSRRRARDPRLPPQIRTNKKSISNQRRHATRAPSAIGSPAKTGLIAPVRAGTVQKVRIE